MTDNDIEHGRRLTGDARRAAALIERSGQSLALTAEAEQEHLWDDLDHEMRWAHHGTWSIACERIVGRIVSLAHHVGPTPAECIPTRLVLSGLYEAILKGAGIACPPIDWVAVHRTDTAIRAGGAWVPAQRAAAPAG